MKYLLELSYDGSPFAGFQRQPGQLTVQGELEDALSRVLREPLAVTCAGRTDKGVHGRGQVVSFRTADARFSGGLVEEANRVLRPRVEIRKVARCPVGFHPRHSALSRTYTYTISTSVKPDSLDRLDVWYLGREPELSRMREAADVFVGEHDFTSFSYRCGTEGNVRRVKEFEIQPSRSLGQRFLSIKIQANGFLRKMARLLVAGVVECGLGECEVSRLVTRLQKRDPAEAPHPAPPYGLCLESIEYENDPFFRPLVQVSAN